MLEVERLYDVQFKCEPVDDANPAPVWKTKTPSVAGTAVGGVPGNLVLQNIIVDSLWKIKVRSELINP